MPARLVHDHEDELVGVTLGDLVEEHRHHPGVDPGQYEAVHHAIVRTDGAEGVEVFALQPPTNDRAHSPWCPAAPRRTQQPEATFVLEHQPHPAALLSLARDLLAYRAAKFF